MRGRQDLRRDRVGHAHGRERRPVRPDQRAAPVLDASNRQSLTMFDTGGTIAAGGAAIAKGHVVVGSGLQYLFAFTAINNNEVQYYGLALIPFVP